MPTRDDDSMSNKLNVSSSSSEIREEEKRQFACGLLLSIAYSASIGGFSTLIGTVC